MYPPQGVRLVAIFVAALLLFACQKSFPSVVGPSAIAPGALASEAEITPSLLPGTWGALPASAGFARLAPDDVDSGALNDSGFRCSFGGGLGVTIDSHATLSPSGNETVVCTGQAAEGVVLPAKTVVLNGEVPCQLRFGPDADPSTPDITFDSHVTLTSTGQITLVCKSKA